MFHPWKILMTYFFSRWLWISNFPPIFIKTLHFPLFWEIYFPQIFLISPLISENFRVFYILYVFFLSPSLIMMHLCITQCTYWMPEYHKLSLCSCWILWEIVWAFVFKGFLCHCFRLLNLSIRFIAHALSASSSSIGVPKGMNTYIWT